MSNFEHLLQSINSLNDTFRNAALHSANRMFTVRNWLIGWYIVEYEQHGEDRAKYGDNMIQRLSSRMAGKRGFSERNLRSFREFYRFYPHFAQAVMNVVSGIESSNSTGLQSVSVNADISQIWQFETAKSLIVEKKPVTEFSAEPEVLLRHFSFTHFVELMSKLQEERAVHEIQKSLI